MSDKTCPTCGSPVKIVGKTTMHYEPIPLRERVEEIVFTVGSREKIVDEIMKLIEPPSVEWLTRVIKDLLYPQDIGGDGKYTCGGYCKRIAEHIHKEWGKR